MIATFTVINVWLDFRISEFSAVLALGASVLRRRSNGHPFLDEDPVTHFVVLPNGQDDEAMFREARGASWPLSLSAEKHVPSGVGHGSPPGVEHSRES